MYLKELSDGRVYFFNQYIQYLKKKFHGNSQYLNKVCKEIC